MNEIAKGQIYIRSASVYRDGELLRTSDINMTADELGGGSARPLLGVEQETDTDLIEIDLIQLSGPPAYIYAVLPWWPFDGGGYGHLGSAAQTEGPGEVAVRFDPKGYKVPAMFGIGAVQARERLPARPLPEPKRYAPHELTPCYVVGKGIVLEPTSPGVPCPERGQHIWWSDCEFVVTAVEFNESRSRWGAIVREVQE